MNYFSRRLRDAIVVASLSLLFPFAIFAQTENQTCSQKGYTIETINGVFTDDAGAKENKENLKKRLPGTFNNEPLTIDYLFNPSHLGGLGDAVKAAYQKYFENETVTDYDLIEMLKDASAKVQTQKLLLVAHSQGNFYANSFYDTVAGQPGGVPKESIGVYSVANPASRVAGGGQWITSDTDKVIAGVVASVPFKKIMPPNTHIMLGAGDDIVGHGLTQAYLKYRSTEIVTGIQASLDKLSSDSVRNENELCINPPKLSVAHKIEGAALAVADPVAIGGIKVASATVKTGVIVGTVVAKTSIGAAVAVYDLGKNTAVFAYNTTEAFAKWGSHMEAVAITWTYNTSIAVAVWGYDTSVIVAKTAWGMAGAIGSFGYDVLTGALLNGQLANNNSASVILATQPVQNLPSVSVNNNKMSIVPPAPAVNNQPVLIVSKPSQPQTVFVFEPKVQSDTNVPKLVFVGSFGGGSGAQAQPAPQVLGTQTTTTIADEVVVVDETIGNAGAGAGLSAPAVSVPQCSQTLATDGCLLPTTSVHFEWPSVAGAGHYLLNKNGATATTTDAFLDTTIRDFSDYTLEVIAVGTDGSSGATSTQKVSVATIPIAINEIAWMGTVASTTNEWFEIKNNTTHTIDLSQWELNAKDGTPHVKLTGTIGPKAYLVFERISDRTISDVTAQQIYTGALGNKGEQLNLSYASTTFDQTPEIVNGEWVAGFNSTSSKQTMERYSSREPGADATNWGTNLGYIKNGTDSGGTAIEGTPGTQNSVSTLVNKGQDITSDFTLTADEERYVVPNGVWVDASSTLTVEPGVTISFLNDSQEQYGYFIVKGEIDARGTPKNPIIFNSFSDNQAGGFWIDNPVGTSTFENAHFENLQSPISVTGGALKIRDSEFVNANGGVESSGASTTALIENTHFASSTSDTIGVYSSTMSISSSTITNQIDGDAIGIYNGTFVMESTIIDGVLDGDGIYAYDSTLNIASSTVRNTENTAISLAYSTTTISNTVVQGGELSDWTTGIDVYHGTAAITDTTVSGFTEVSGIGVTGPAMPVTISGGEISRNAMGIEMSSADSVVVTDVSMHDNGKDIVVW